MVPAAWPFIRPASLDKVPVVINSEHLFAGNAVLLSVGSNNDLPAIGHLDLQALPIWPVLLHFVSDFLRL